MPEQPSASVAESCSIHDFDELLSLDDIFVEYFNEFLRLGTFVQKVEYNRELNTFTEIKQDQNLLDTNNENKQINDNENDNLSVYSGFSDFIQLDNVPDETNKNSRRKQKLRQVQIMDWAKNERLGLFWRTELYRQYKLCKLLLRPLTIEKEASEYSSQGIGGYSRQSIYTAARTLSTDNSNGYGVVPTATLEEDEEQQDSEPNDSILNANTIFENSILASELLRMPRPFLRPGSRAYSVPANMVSSLTIFFPTLQTKYSTKMSKRSSSSKTSQRKLSPKDDENTSSNDANEPSNHSLYNGVKIKYFEDADNEEENYDVGDFGLQIQSSSNQLKYKYLGSLNGMQSFVRFLKTTKGGYDLYRFWMDCEFFKDTMAGLDQIEHVIARTRLFRDLNDGKYHLPFMRHLQNKIRRAYAETAGVLTHDVFLQVQYDVLRRLRIYWSARFIIHKLFEQHHPKLQLPMEEKRPADVCLYPIDQKAQANLVEMTRVFLSDDYTTNENIVLTGTNNLIQDEVERSFDNIFMKKYSTVIHQDKYAGGIFLRYITFKERLLLPLMLFCYDVDDFRHSNIDDKVLESQHGLSILNTYFGNSARLSLDNFMPDIRIQLWVETFHNHKFNKLTFEPLFKRALLILKDAWLRCIKEDVDRFTAAYYLTSSSPPSSKGTRETENDDEYAEENEDENEDEEEEDEDEEKTLPVITKPKMSIQRLHSPDTQIRISNNVIYIKRPWLNRFIPSAATERQDRLLEALENAMTEDERKRLRAERVERLRRIEENRKRALKAARERQKKQANEKDSLSTSDKNSQSRRRDLGLYIDRILPSKTSTVSKESQRLLLSNFQRYMKSKKSVPPKLDHKLGFLVETTKWLETTNPFEKQQQFDRIRKTYFDPQSKRTILPLSAEQTESLDLNNGRPDPALLQALHRDLRSEVEEIFVHYCEDRIQEFEIDSIEEFLTKSADDLTLLFHDLHDGTGTNNDDDDIGTLIDPDLEAIASNNDGTGKATKKHHGELLQIITDAAVGRFNERFYYFYAYLTHWVDPKKAPHLDQDFLFCVDVSRLKEIVNDSLLQSKVRYILETYLDGTQTSSTINCHLDLLSTDLQLRMLRALQKSLQSNVNDFSSLEEARSMLVKDKLVYYYAGFKAYLFRMNLTKTHPSRLAKLQEQLTVIQQQQRAAKSAKTTTRSSASTNKNVSIKKPVSVMSNRQSAPPTSIDITTITKTQHLLDERMKKFQSIQQNQINEVALPITNKPVREKSATNNKIRQSNVHDGQTIHTEGTNSTKEKARGPVSFQYTLTSGLKIKYPDGKPPTEINTNGHDGTLNQPRASMAYSFGSAND